MRIYLDHNAGAPLRAEARAAMLDVLDGPPANPSSAHREGARARRVLEDARAEGAARLGAEPGEVVFTSGATEANNLALRGVLAASGERRGLVVTAIEHASVLEPARRLAQEGLCLTAVPVDGAGRVDAAGGREGERALPAAAGAGGGRVDAAGVVAACDDGTALVSVGLANGEVASVA